MYVYDRVSTRGVLGRQIDSSWWNILAISHFQPCSTTGATKVMVCFILSMGWCI